jgi:hypothetical protein
LVTCGSVWSCPVCAAKIAARRAQELSQVTAVEDPVPAVLTVPNHLNAPETVDAPPSAPSIFLPAANSNRTLVRYDPVTPTRSTDPDDQ